MFMPYKKGKSLSMSRRAVYPSVGSTGDRLRCYSHGGEGDSRHLLVTTAISSERIQHDRQDQNPGDRIRLTTPSTQLSTLVLST